MALASPVVIVGQTNYLVDKLRLIATNLPFTGVALALVWRDSDLQYWDEVSSAWVPGAFYNTVGVTHMGQGMYSYPLVIPALTGMDGDVIHYAITDSAVEATVTTISQGGSAKVLAGELLHRGTWTDTLATDLATVATATPAVIADAVWDETRTDHVAVGSFGESIQDVLASAANIADAVWDEVFSGHVSDNTMGRLVRDIFWAEFNRRKVNATTNREELYEADGSTLLKEWDLKDSAGAPASINVFEKVPV